jgi:hypothetical protein
VSTLQAEHSRDEVQEQAVAESKLSLPLAFESDMKELWSRVRDARRQQDDWMPIGSLPPLHRMRRWSWNWQQEAAQ